MGMLRRLAVTAVCAAVMGIAAEAVVQREMPQRGGAGQRGRGGSSLARGSVAGVEQRT